MKINADAVSEGGTLSEQDRVGSTTPVKSTQTTLAPPPVRPISSIATSKERKVWMSQRRIQVRAIMLRLLALAAFLIWPRQQTAGELFQKSADQGYGSAQNNLGVVYENGQGVSKDLGRAAELYQKAADQGNASAQKNLGVLYENGQGVPKDLGRAAELYQKAADQGYARAQYNLGTLYQDGGGVPKDLGKARELYRKAANQGYAPAITQLKALP